MKAIFLTILISLHVKMLIAQLGNHYLEQIEGNRVEFETTLIMDTFWLYRDSVNNRFPNKTYDFKFTVIEGKDILTERSSRFGGADPDYNSNYTRGPLQPGMKGKVSISFPGRRFPPPYVHKRRYLANNNSEKRDTLTIMQVFLWADRDTIHSTVKLGETSINIVEHLVDHKRRIMFVNVHEDEQTSIEVLKRYSQEAKINYAYLTHDSTRRVMFQSDDQTFTIDPNRIYTEEGIKKTIADSLTWDQKDYYAVRRFAASLSYKLIGKEYTITLHNNTPDNYSILSYLPDGEESENTELVFVNPEMDPDDFVYTTDLNLFQKLREEQVSVILQKANPVDDGSLSVLCGLKNVPYANIETEHGHFDEQLRLTRLVHSIVSNFLLDTNK